jgi:hypothetical protein
MLTFEEFLNALYFETEGVPYPNHILFISTKLINYNERQVSTTPCLCLLAKYTYTEPYTTVYRSYGLPNCGRLWQPRCLWSAARPAWTYLMVPSQPAASGIILRLLNLSPIHNVCHACFGIEENWRKAFLAEQYHRAVYICRFSSIIFQRPGKNNIVRVVVDYSLSADGIDRMCLVPSAPVTHRRYHFISSPWSFPMASLAGRRWLLARWYPRGPWYSLQLGLLQVEL